MVLWGLLGMLWWGVVRMLFGVLLGCGWDAVEFGGAWRAGKRTSPGGFRVLVVVVVALVVGLGWALFFDIPCEGIGSSDPDLSVIPNTNTKH